MNNEKRTTIEREKLPTTFYLLRHGPTVFNIEHRLQGQVDTDIIPERIGAYIQALNVSYLPQPERVVVTGLRRTRQTYEALRKIKQWPELPLLVRPDMNERALGVLEGKTQLEVKAMMLNGQVPVSVEKEILEEMTDLSSILEAPTYTPPQGESMAEVGKRIREGLIDLSAQYPGETILVVNHYAGLNSQGLDPKEISKVEVAQTPNGQWQIEKRDFTQ